MRFGAIAWRSLAARPLRTILTTLGVALGVAIVGATLTANEASSRALERAAAQVLGSADLRVRAFNDAGFSPRAVTSMRRTTGVMNAAAVSERQVQTVSDLDQTAFRLLLLGVDPVDEAHLRSHDLAAGSFLDETRPEGVLVSDRWAGEHGFGVGDELILTGHATDVPNVRIVGLLAERGFGALNNGAVMVLQRPFLAQAFDVPVPIRYVDLAIANDRAADVQAQLDANLTEPFVVETAADAEAQLARAQAGFAGLAFLFGMVALAVGGFLVANTLSLTVGERTRELGLLRAAGTTGRQVLELVLRQGLAIGVVGGLAGVLGGILATGLLIAFLRSTRAVLVEGVPFALGSLLLAFMLGLLITLGGAAAPALAARRISPLDALRPSRQPGRTLAGRLRWVVGLSAAAVAVGAIAYPVERGDSSPLGTLLAVAVLIGGTLAVAASLVPLSRLVGRPFIWFFGAEGLLGRANLGRDRARTGLTVGTLVIGLSAVVALGAVASSARATADRWVESILPGGHAARFGVPLDMAGFRPTFEEIAGIDDIAPIPEIAAVIAGEEVPREVSLAGIDPSIFQDHGTLLFVAGGRAAAFEALRAGGAVLVPDAVARRDGLTIGAMLPLALPGGEVHAFRVAGVVAYTLPARSPDGALLIGLADARNVFGAQAARLWGLAPQADVELSGFGSSAREAVETIGGELVTADQLADELGRGLDRLIGLFDILALLAVLIGGLGIVNTMAVSVVERGREIAILRSHGMTVSQVQAMVVAEASIIGAVGGLAAAALGLLVAWATVTVGAPRDFAAGLAIPWLLLPAAVLLGVAVASAAGIYPARVAARTPITANLKHFE